jgi:FkbM family methyltransferase
MINFFKLNKKTPKHNINQFDIIIKKGDICIDAGSNVGNITAQMLDYGAKVYAFEPNPFAFAKLEQRFILNKNVVCFNKGVYSKQDKMALYFHENSHEDEVKWSTGSSLLDFKSNVD